jgi:nucleotide-binding universal stress UspA family protein
MYKSILVPLDGSTFAEHALPLALAVARLSGASLHLVHVLQPLASVYSEAPLFADGDLEARIKDRLRGYLDSVACRLGRLSPTAITAVLEEGEIVPTLRRFASDSRADLVVMTTHGRGPLGRFWLGSVADELVRVLPMPLLLVRPADTVSDAAQFGIEPPLKKILIPLDGSKLAEQMIDRAVELGRLTGAAFTLLGVIKPVPDVAFPTGSASLDAEVQNMIKQMDALQEKQRAEMSIYLEGVARPLREEGLCVGTKVAIGERPGVSILREATPPAVDLVALETHGRRGLSRLILGSVADKVIRGAAVPVLVHRPSHA